MLEISISDVGPKCLNFQSIKREDPGFVLQKPPFLRVAVNLDLTSRNAFLTLPFQTMEKFPTNGVKT